MFGCFTQLSDPFAFFPRKPTFHSHVGHNKDKVLTKLSRGQNIFQTLFSGLRSHLLQRAPPLRTCSAVPLPLAGVEHSLLCCRQIHWSNRDKIYLFIAQTLKRTWIDLICKETMKTNSVRQHAAVSTAPRQVRVLCRMQTPSNRATMLVVRTSHLSNCFPFHLYLPRPMMLHFNILNIRNSKVTERRAKNASQGFWIQLRSEALHQTQLYLL